MKHFIQNFALVGVSVMLFALPFLGFTFVSSEKASPQPVVLGAKTVVVEPEIVDQIEYDVSLGDTTIQRLYNVLPEKYLSKNYRVVISIPNDAVESGVEVNLVQENDTADVVITTPFDFDAQSLPGMRLILIVLE